MANKALFGSLPGGYVPPADAKNEAGGKAYAYTPQQALAQYACTGTLNNAFYVSAEESLDKTIGLCKQVEPWFIGATAIYARQHALMKDMPALLCAVLAGHKTDESRRVLEHAFPQVIDNAKMLRNFVQMVRSGRLGRKSFGSQPRRLVANWLLNKAQKSPRGLFRDLVGNDPSLRDIIRLSRPKPTEGSPEAAFLAYLTEKRTRHVAEGGAVTYLPAWSYDKQPSFVQAYEDFKALKAGKGHPEVTIEDVAWVDFRQLDNLPLTTDEWKHIARNAGWQMTRMNINTFARHDVLKDPEMVKLIAARLADEQAIRGSRAFPYQLMMAYNAVGPETPPEIRNALQTAMEFATENIQSLGRGAVCVDVSGSMSSPITGANGKVQSKVRIVDVAALIAAVLMRKNPQTIVLPFDTKVWLANKDSILNPRDSIMTLANQLARFGGGGTACALPMYYLNEKQVSGLDYVLYLSDSESWFDVDATKDSPYHNYTRNQGTETLQQWEQVKARNPSAKLICVNLAQAQTSQAPTRRDVLNIGGWTDTVFDVIRSFMAEAGPDHWVTEISKCWDLSKNPLTTDLF